MAKHSWKVTRFLVFRFVKKFHAEMGRVPTGPEIAAELGITSNNALFHMRALMGADGMPSYTAGRYRNLGNENAAHASALGSQARGIDFDYNMLPVDRLIIA